MAAQSKDLFSTRDQEIAGIKFGGDSAITGIKYEGVLADDLPDGMKDGDVLRLHGRSEFEFKDGRKYRLTDFS